jgi:hypothetical protein
MNYLAIGCIVFTIIIIILIIVKERERFTDIQQPIENPITKDKSSNDKIYPSYWYGYFPSDTRSKCFDCDNTSNFEHGTNCFDCEIPGGRQINPLLNRVLTR